MTMAVSALLLLVVLLEVALNAAWHPLYFTRGVPLFRRALQRAAPLDLAAGDWPRGLTRRRLDAERVAFRDELIGSRLFFAATVMHGLLHRDARTGVVCVIGLANWFPPCMLLVLLPQAVAQPRRALVSVVALVLLGLLYARQRSQYLALCRRLEARVRAGSATNR